MSRIIRNEAFGYLNPATKLHKPKAGSVTIPLYTNSVKNQ